MLFTEDQLNLSTNPWHILDEACYLTDEEAAIYPKMVVVKENSQIGAYIIDFNGIRGLSEQYGIDYIDSIVAVAEADGIDLDNICIAIDEADIIEHPEFSTIGPMVVTPLSENNPEYILTELFLEHLMSESYDWDETELAHLLLEVGFEDLTKQLNVAYDEYKRKHNGQINPEIKQDYRQTIKLIHPDLYGAQALVPANIEQQVEDIIQKMRGVTPSASDGGGGNAPPLPPKSGSGGGFNGGGFNGGGNVPPPPNSGSGGGNVPLLPPGSGAGSGGSNGMSFGKKAAIGAGIAAAIGGGVLAYQHYKNKPKSVIAKRIAALRSIYQKFLRNAQANPEKAGIFKRMAAKILGVIDKLMSFLQRKADGR